MAHVNTLYADTDDIKKALAIQVSDPADDELIHEIAEAASRMIDEYCGQFFYSTAGTAYYTPPLHKIVETDPFTAVTSIATDEDGDGVYETVWQAGDYYTQPYNAAMFGKPYTAIQVAPDGDQVFSPSIDKSVKLVATFGWASVPKAVQQACIIAATTLYEGRKAPFGIVGSSEQGTVLRLSNRLHPEAALLLEPYRLHDGVVA